MTRQKSLKILVEKNNNNTVISSLSYNVQSLKRAYYQFLLHLPECPFFWPYMELGNSVGKRCWVSPALLGWAVLLRGALPADMGYYHEGLTDTLKSSPEDLSLNRWGVIWAISVYPCTRYRFFELSSSGLAPQESWLIQMIVYKHSCVSTKCFVWWQMFLHFLCVMYCQRTQ